MVHFPIQFSKYDVTEKQLSRINRGRLKDYGREMRKINQTEYGLMLRIPQAGISFQAATKLPPLVDSPEILRLVQGSLEHKALLCLLHRRSLVVIQWPNEGFVLIRPIDVGECVRRYEEFVEQARGA